MSTYADGIARVFQSAGATTIQWQAASRCSCAAADTQQPGWDCPECSGFGVTYAPAVAVQGLFRSQSRFFSPRLEGEVGHGEAALTTNVLPVTIAGTTFPGWKPEYVDRRVRDRLTVPEVAADAQRGRVFYPAAEPVPFLINEEHLAWRVQLQSLEQSQRVQAQP